MSSDEEGGDYEYGSLIEDSLKEFSLSLTKVQLELFDAFNAESEKKTPD